jgi:hypothetical protein
MTVQATSNKVSYTGSTATVHPYGFKVFEDSDLKVYKTSGSTTSLLTLGTDYTVSGAGEESGGNVTLSAAPESADIITIQRVLPLSQLIDYQPLDAFPAESHEEGLDRLTMIAQQLDEESGRMVKAPVYSASTADLTLPEPEAGKVIGVWNETASAIEIGPSATDIANAQGYASSAAASAASAAASAAAAAPVKVSPALLLHPYMGCGYGQFWAGGWKPHGFNQQWGGSWGGALPDGSGGEAWFEGYLANSEVGYYLLGQ